MSVNIDGKITYRETYQKTRGTIFEPEKISLPTLNDGWIVEKARIMAVGIMEYKDGTTREFQDIRVIIKPPK